MSISMRWRACAVAAGALSVAALAAPVTAASAATTRPASRHVLPGSRPSWQSNPKFRKVGSVAGSTRESAKVWLAPNDPAGLAALATAVSDPASSSYGRYLSHDAYVQRFAPTAAQVRSVTQWLSGAGLTVGTVGPDSHYVTVSGSAAAVSAAFGTSLARYDFAGTTVQAPSSDLSVPDSLAGRVLAVTGLTPAGHTVRRYDLGAPEAYVNGVPCSSYYGEKTASTLPKYKGRTLPYAVCGYTPRQLRSTYGITQSRQTGKGVTVAITDAFDSSTLEQDANTYAQRHGDPTLKRGQFQDISFGEGKTLEPPDVTTDPIGDCGGNGWYGEQALDVEAVHGLAVDASIQYVGAASCLDDDLLASLSRIVQVNKASIVSNSWGEPTVIANEPDYGCTADSPCLTIDQTLVDAYESIFQQGAVQGIGFYFSSGDDGDEALNAGYTHPDFPSGDPWVTAVGGTALGVDAHGRRGFETGWGTSRWDVSASGRSWTQTTPFLYGAGGGYSQVFEQPSYQNGVVRANPTGGRAVPDVAMVADPTTGMLVGQTQAFSLPSRYGGTGTHYGEYRVGGTSLASPLFAAAQAVAQQGRGRIGFANPLIYALATSSHGGVFNDIAGAGPDAGNVRADFTNGYNSTGGYTYSLRTFDQDSSLATGRGWDDVTGVGTVTAQYLRRVSGTGSTGGAGSGGPGGGHPGKR